MKNTDLYLKKLLKKTLNETFEEKANELREKLMDGEMEEGFDSPEIKFDRGGKDYDKDEFKKYRFRPYEFEKDYDLDSTTEDEFEYRVKTKDIDLDDELYGDEDDDFDFFTREDDDIEPINEGETCEQCGKEMTEGECTECGMKYEGFDIDSDDEMMVRDETETITDKDVIDEYCNEESHKYNARMCQIHQEMLNEEIKEKLHGKQTKLDKNKNGKIDAEDFKMLRNKKEVSEKWKGDVEVEKTGEYSDMSIEEINSAIKKLKKQNEKYTEDGKKVPQKNKEKMSELYFAKRAKQGWKGKGKAAVEEEVEEGNAFTAKLAKARKGDKFTMNGKTYTDTSDYDVKESVEYHIRDNQGETIKLNESEMINLIESIVLEQEKKGIKSLGKPKGLAVYEKARKDSGKENDDYLKSVAKKMGDYLKDGSKGKYETEPKHFPKGNGELAKMDKKAFKMTDDLEDFNYEIAGQNFPVPDAIDYNEDWMDKLFDGDSMTGNAPGGNALESEANKRFNKMRKKNTLKKLKDQSYKRVSQPVYNEKSGDSDGKGLNIKLESLEEREKMKLNEEFNRMKNLFSYSKKTQ